MADNCIAFDFRENEMHVEIPGWRVHFAPAVRRRPKIAFWWVLHFRYILGCDRYDQKKIFQKCHISTTLRDTAMHFRDSLCVSFPNISKLYFYLLPLATRKYSWHKMHGTQIFIYSLIYCLYSTSDNTAFAKAKCVFFFLPENVRRYNIKSYFVFRSLNKFWALCNHEIFERIFFPHRFSRDW